MLNEDKRKIVTISRDPELQFSIITAMFNGCERGTDLWEHLEEDANKFKELTRLFLWGERDEEDEEEGAEPEDCIYNVSPPKEVIEFLLDQVQARLKERLQV